MAEWKGILTGIGITILVVIILTMWSWHIAIKRVNKELQQNPKFRREIISQMKDALAKYETELDTQTTSTA